MLWNRSLQGTTNSSSGEDGDELIGRFSATDIPTQYFRLLVGFVCFMAFVNECKCDSEKAQFPLRSCTVFHGQPPLPNESEWKPETGPSVVSRRNNTTFPSHKHERGLVPDTNPSHDIAPTFQPAIALDSAVLRQTLHDFWRFCIYGISRLGLLRDPRPKHDHDASDP